MRLLLLAPFALAAGCATSDAALERRRDVLEAELAGLRGRIDKVDSELARALQTTGRAAQGAGLAEAPCAAMTADGGPVSPRSGTRTLRFTLGAPAAIVATFNPPKSSNGRRVYAAACQAVSP
jgi:hypothetical protein